MCLCLNSLSCCCDLMSSDGAGCLSSVRFLIKIRKPKLLHVILYSEAVTYRNIINGLLCHQHGSFKHFYLTAAVNVIALKVINGFEEKTDSEQYSLYSVIIYNGYVSIIAGLFYSFTSLP